MSFDILTAELSDTASFQLEHPSNGPMFDGDKPVTFEIYGRTSSVWRNWIASQARKNAAKEKAGKKAKMLTPEEALAERAEMYATITKSITGLSIGGEEVDNFEMYKKLYGNPKLDWVVTQVDQAFGDIDSFLSE